MFLGQPIAYTRLGTTFTITTNTDEVGAFHFEQTGYTAVQAQGGSVNETYDLVDGWNLITFDNEAVGTLTLTFTGSGTVTWGTSRLFKSEIVLASEITRDRPRTYRPTYSVFRAPRRLPVGTSAKIAASFGFEWRYLDWDKVDILESIFHRHGALGNPEITLIPDGFEAERFRVVITSPFDFYPSVNGNFNSGASGALVFETV